jgi:hypothetical protein
MTNHIIILQRILNNEIGYIKTMKNIIFEAFDAQEIEKSF